MTKTRPTACVPNTECPLRADSIMPHEIAVKAEDIGVRKGRMDLAEMFLLAVLAGAFIAFGAIFATTAATGADGRLPYGVAKTLAGVVFSLGLILVVVAGAELFTGNNLLVMAFASGKLRFDRLLRNWAVVYAGNFVGATATAWLMLHAGQFEMGDGAVGATALAIANAKCNLSLAAALTRGVACNVLVCLAVWLCYSCRTTGEKVLVIVFPITAFVAAGFEHCVANMYFIPVGLFILHSAPEAFWNTARIAPGDFPYLTWTNFVWINLLPVTIGNVIGGSVFIGGVYHFIYLKKAGAVHKAQQVASVAKPTVDGGQA